VTLHVLDNDFTPLSWASDVVGGLGLRRASEGKNHAPSLMSQLATRNES
jgi:hypothetical protein